MNNVCPICLESFGVHLWSHIEKCAKKKADQEAKERREAEEKRRAYRKAEGFAN